MTAITSGIAVDAEAAPTHLGYPIQWENLPGAIDPERPQPFGLALIQVVLNHAIHAAAAGPALQARPEFGQIGGIAVRHHFYLAILGVTHPSAQIKFAGLPMHKPTEAHPLHPTLNQKMKNHGLQLSSPVLASFSDVASATQPGSPAAECFELIRSRYPPT